MAYLFNKANTLAITFFMCFHMYCFCYSSRDKACLEDLITETWIELLIERACLKDCKGLDTEQANTIAIEALKCLCNVIFNCNAVARMCSKNGLMNYIIERIKNYK